MSVCGQRSSFVVKDETVSAEGGGGGVGDEFEMSRIL